MSKQQQEEGEETVVWSDPPCKLLVRSKTQIEVFTVPERNNAAPPATEDAKQRRKVVLVRGATSMVRMTGGAAYVLLNGVGVVKCDLVHLPDTPLDKNNTPQPFLRSSAGVQMMDVSPLGTHLLTWERYYADKCPNNLKLWRCDTGKLVAAFCQKNIKREAWPYLQWTFDERLAFLMASNEVRVYEASELGGTPAANDSADEDPAAARYVDKLRIPDISTLSLPQTSATSNAGSSETYIFTSFCPGTKDKPARASLHEYRKTASPANNGNSNSSSNYPAKMTKSLFQAEDMKTHWSPNGDAALVTLQTSVDASGESYYGSSRLFLLSRQAADVQAVPLDNAAQQGPVSAVEWMPNPAKPPCFAVVAGKVPAMSSLHNGQTGEAAFLFGQAHRNHIAWSPHGRFLFLAGFGNLAGGMGFWDRNKLKLIPHVAENVQGTLRASSTTGFQWSPDSRLMCLSSAAPRLNVDNEIRLFRYTGEEIVTGLPWDKGQYRPDQLLEAVFVPAPSPQTYPDRPQSPAPPGAIAATRTSNSNAAQPSWPSSAGGRYVPPSARGGGGGRGRGTGGSSLAERMRQERDGALQGATVVKKNQPKAVKSATGRVIPGMAQEPATKSKSALKREKVKLKKQQEEATKEQEAPPPPPDQKSSADPEKRGRKIKKTLKQIEDLKQKDPGSLNDDQTAKIASEASLLAELEQLGL